MANILFSYELTLRELDARLLLGYVQTAQNGHQVYISDMKKIEMLARFNLIKNFILLVKSITPSQIKIERHGYMKEKGVFVTSLDEEGFHRLGDNYYEDFISNRYGDVTLEQVESVFTWSEKEANVINKKFPGHEKIHIVGNPIVDLWSWKFKDYWGAPEECTRINICSSLL